MVPREIWEGAEVRSCNQWSELHSSWPDYAVIVHVPVPDRDPSRMK